MISLVHRRSGGGRSVCIALTVAVLLTTARASADPPVSDGAALEAEQLFRAGKSLMAAADYANACPKFSRSQRLDPGIGTLLALALCHEGQGLFATAWTEFREALPLARKDGRSDRIDLATRHLVRLEPRVSRLSVHISPEAGAIASLNVSVDGKPLSHDEMALGLAIDPGPHTLVATATGHETWQGRVTAEGDGERYEVTIPRLAEVTVPAAPLPPATAATVLLPPAEDARKPPSASGGPPALRWVAYGLVGMGAAAAVTGSAFGLLAMSNADKANQACPTTSCSDAHAVELNNQARTSALVSNTAFGIAIAGLTTGTILWFLTPSTSERSVRAAAGPGGISVDYLQRF